MEHLKVTMKEKPKNWLIVIVTIVIIIAVGLHYKFIFVGIGWQQGFHYFTHALFSGGLPNKLLGMFYPPWVLIPFVPLPLLPERGGTIFFYFALTSYFINLRKLNVNLLTSLVFLFLSPVLEDLRQFYIKRLVMLGYFTPNQIGLFFVLIKPQAGGAVSILLEHGRTSTILKG